MWCRQNDCTELWCNDGRIVTQYGLAVPRRYLDIVLRPIPDGCMFRRNFILFVTVAWDRSIGSLINLALDTSRRRWRVSSGDRHPWKGAYLTRWLATEDPRKYSRVRGFGGGDLVGAVFTTAPLARRNTGLDLGNVRTAT